MPDTQKKFYLTTPIYYVNARPHIGHAYTTIAADVIARRHRLLGDDTFFLTGTDEHGQKIQRSAEAAGVPPQQFADEVSASFQNLWKRMGITNDAYIRTTDPHHKKGVQQLFRTLQQNGYIELRTYTGQYCISDETFVDVPVGAPCPECGRVTETVTEENYFFKLSEFQRPLIDLIESNTLTIQPDSRRNEVLSFLRGNVANSSVILSEAKNPRISPEVPQNSPESAPPDAVILSERSESKDPDGLNPANASQTISVTNIQHSAKGNPYIPGALKDLSISRTSVKWGIPVPGDEKHVIYVWLDALSNYMTAIGYGSDDPAEQAKFKKYWPADLHLVGKEIIRFHCVYWPAFLMAMKPADTTQEEWNRKMLPKQITAHGWLLFENDKMSKSKGNIVRTETILDAFGTLCPPQSTPSQPPQLSSFREAGGPASLSGVAKERTEGTTAGPAKGTPSTPPQLSSFREAGGPAVPSGAPHNAPALHNAPASGGSTGLQPGESTTTEKGALAPGILTDEAWKHEQDLFAADVLRYFLLREIPFGQDGSFSFDALVQRYNSDLANGYGNLVSRTLSMIQKYSNSRMPVPIKLLPNELPQHAQEYFFSFISGPGKMGYANEAEKKHYQLRFSAGPLEQGVRQAFEHFDLTRTAENPLWAVSRTDSYLSSNAPWKMIEGAERDDVLYTAAESIRIITALLYPILPYATSKVWAQLGLGDIEEAARKGELKDLQWGGLKPDTKLGPISPIFPRADKGLIQIMNDMEQNNTPHKPAQSIGLPQVNADLDASTHHRTEFRESPIASVSATPSLNKAAESVHTFAPPQTAETVRPETPQIAIDDFIKIDLRVAQIVVAERIPKADKLLRLEVDLGYERRQILSGIAQWYTPEELIGRRIVVIANLAPRKMRGLESHGMLLAASHGEDGKPVLATFGEDIALGSRLK